MLSTTPNCREQIQQALQKCRQRTLEQFDRIDDTALCHQAHPEFSPIGWHLGHIAYTEDLWLLQTCAGLPPVFPQYHQLFSAEISPKQERANLPSRSEIREYLDKVREAVWEYLDVAPLEHEERLWQFVLQHESQHSETMALVEKLLQLPDIPTENAAISVGATHRSDDMVKIPAGRFWRGNNGMEALDNERPGHWCFVPTYWIDRYPVTCGEYQQFIAAGGYKDPQWWTPAGWEWVQKQSRRQPLYWHLQCEKPDHPVCGVSWFEATAYANFVGKRLPTEIEWEKAARGHPDDETRRLYPWGDAFPDATRSNHDGYVGTTTPVDAYPEGASAYGVYDMLGNVWEWTSSLFDGYEGFEFYPYPGYSQQYFDGQHYVMRGGSWTTRPWVLRSSFRNWYYPHIRELFVGFRLAASE